MANNNNTRQSLNEEDYFDSDPMRSIKKQKRKARRHRSKETLRDLTKGDKVDFNVYDDYHDNFEEF